MPSDKRNLITTKAIGLICSLFNVTSFGDVPFHQLLQLQCLHHGSIKFVQHTHTNTMIHTLVMLTLTGKILAT